MGKKRRGGRCMRHEEDFGDEAASVASIETRGTIMSDDENFDVGYSKDLVDKHQIDEAIDDLTEERTTTRIAALEKLTIYLLQYVAPEDVTDSFLNNVLGCLRKPSEADSTASLTPEIKPVPWAYELAKDMLRQDYNGITKEDADGLHFIMLPLWQNLP